MAEELRWVFYKEVPDPHRRNHGTIRLELARFTGGTAYPYGTVVCRRADRPDEMWKFYGTKAEAAKVFGEPIPLDADGIAAKVADHAKAILFDRGVDGVMAEELRVAVRNLVGGRLRGGRRRSVPTFNRDEACGGSRPTTAQEAAEQRMDARSVGRAPLGANKERDERIKGVWCDTCHCHPDHVACGACGNPIATTFRTHCGICGSPLPEAT